jgi:hypothetical protein
MMMRFGMNSEYPTLACRRWGTFSGTPRAIVFGSAASGLEGLAGQYDADVQIHNFVQKFGRLPGLCIYIHVDAKVVHETKRVGKL